MIMKINGLMQGISKRFLFVRLPQNVARHGRLMFHQLDVPFVTAKLPGRSFANGPLICPPRIGQMVVLIPFLNG
jgi:hypothetical protein